MTSALEGVAAKLQEALGDHAGSQVSSGEMSTEAGTTSCGTEGSLSTREKKEAADELASLEAALSALGATRGTTQIAQELREQIASKKKTLAATKPIEARVDGCRAWAARCKTRRDQALEAFRLASAALEKADEEVAQSARELAVLEEELARVQYGPAAETPAAVATELARCMNKTLGDMKKFHNIPQDHVNEMETLMKTLVEGVARLATSFSQKAGDEMELEESKAKRLRMVQKQPIQPHLDQGGGEPQHTTASTASTVLIAESLDMEGHTG